MSTQQAPLSLLLDAGNTRVKAGWFHHGSRARENKALTAPLDQLPSLIMELTRELTNAGVALVGVGNGHNAMARHQQPIRALGVSSASDAVMHQMQDLLQQHLGATTQWLQSCQWAAGLFSQYDPPQQLGADRWAAMLGMMQHLEHDVPVMLASFGTATTIDTLYAQGQRLNTGNTNLHHNPTTVSATSTNTAAVSGFPAQTRAVFAGGLILPGPHLMLQSLATGTARLPLALATASAFPTHTHQAIYSGVLAAQAGAVVRQWRAVLTRFGMAPRVFVTGGNWPTVCDELQHVLALAQHDTGQMAQPARWLENPVLDGLAQWARHNEMQP